MLAFDVRNSVRQRADLASDAEDALARLDERLRQSPIRDGWISRTNILDACANLWLEGDLVALEDLVLHDLSMDVRTPTHELTRAHMFLRARRKIAAAPPGWAFEPEHHDQLRGRLGPDIVPTIGSTQAEEGGSAPLDNEFAAIDALIARTQKVLARGAIPREGAYEPQHDRLAEWRGRLAETEALTPVAAAAAAGEAWEDLRPIENASWLGRLLAAEVLRTRGKTRVHLCTLSLGLKGVARADRQSRDPATRKRAWVHGFALAAETGLRDHDRWLAARQSLEQKLKGRRSTSKLPKLVLLVMRQPIVTSSIIGKEVGVSGRAAQNLVAELGLREMTGRTRYRAWGIL